MDNITTKMLLEDRRFRIASIKPELLIGVLNWANNPKCALALPVMSEIPADCIAVSVSTSWDRGTIDVIIAHADFDRLPPGALIPRCHQLVTEFRIVSAQDVLENSEAG
ncbi:MAG: hypothetical protein V4719_00930 [Planctomycetota bacterium]